MDETFGIEEMRFLVNVGFGKLDLIIKGVFSSYLGPIVDKVDIFIVVTWVIAHS